MAPQIIKGCGKQYKRSRDMLARPAIGKVASPAEAGLFLAAGWVRILRLYIWYNEKNKNEKKNTGDMRKYKKNLSKPEVN